jgi:hypothetical protein
MTGQTTAAISVRPIVSWPRQAVVGQTYLMTIDLSLVGDAPWPYEQEEYTIFCIPSTGPNCRLRPIGQNAVVLHRFGGTYGAARFLITPNTSADDANLLLTLVNPWGIPILSRPLPMRIEQPGPERADLPEHRAVGFVERSRQGDEGKRPIRLFLSYAEEDGQAALQIAARLGERFEVFDWQQQRGGRVLERIEQEINRADAYVALLSPHFLASPYCGLERELAIQRELDLRARDPGRSFVNVLQITETPYPSVGFLRSYDWLDLTTAEKREQGMEALSARLASNVALASVPDTPIRGQGYPMFRDRDHELETVQRGLTDPGGPHFWLVIAPIGLGKSWFLQQLGTRMALPESSDAASESTPWVVKLVDVREQPRGVRSDAGLLLASLFERTAPVTTGPDGLQAIAREINRAGRPYLCLLDSAELLERATARTLRSYLSQIRDMVQQGRAIDVRLAFVVASRRASDWFGVAPAPRLAAQTLSEFTVEVLQQALVDLARQMRRLLAASELQQHAERLHRLSEGLPALLVACLQWIQREQWLRMERLESQEVFEELAVPYIEHSLLSVISLFPQGGQDLTAKREALVHAFRVLSPYRLFTQSHLRYHIQSEPALADALAGLRWTIEDLWQAISQTALLSLQRELFQEIFPPIRRLLYYFYYKTNEQRADAHREARKFTEIWADRQTGLEQVIGLVECLWHEAAMLALVRPAELERQLLKSARILSRALRESPAYTLEELRRNVVERIDNDAELQGAVGNFAGLSERLAAAVMSP